jgi:hypothetical protein
VRRFRRIIVDVGTVVSLLLFVAAAVGWVVGGVREKQTTMWRVWPRAERTFFVRVERQHLILSEQHLVPVGLPQGYAVDSREFRVCRVMGPMFPPGGVRSEVSPDYFALNPPGAWFAVMDLDPGGVRVMDASGGTAWRVRNLYRAVAGT